MLVASVPTPSTSNSKPLTIRIGTRESQLAQLQTTIVTEALKAKHPGLDVKTVFVTTGGDKTLDRPISALGTRGVFVKELEEALFASEVDLVVHSLKDLPTDLPDGLCLAAVLNREDTRDVLISRDRKKFRDLPPGSKVATSSRRRTAQLRHIRKDLEFIDIRGNVPTRIRKHEEGLCDAIVLAAAGLIRLELEEKITEYFAFEVSTPAAGQGALAIECRSADSDILDLVAAIEDVEVRAEITAERAFLDKLGGGCSVPIGAVSRFHSQGTMSLLGCVASIDGEKLIRTSAQGSIEEAEQIGINLANKLLDLGAGDLLEHLKLVPVTVSPP
jgi:hydroxymethylbilane synthase